MIRPSRDVDRDSHSTAQSKTARKLAMVGEMNKTVKMLALAGIRSRYPNESPEKQQRRLADLILGPE